MSQEIFRIVLIESENLHALLSRGVQQQIRESLSLSLCSCIANLLSVCHVNSRHGHGDTLPSFFIGDPGRTLYQGIKDRVGNIDCEHRHPMLHCNFDVPGLFVR